MRRVRRGLGCHRSSGRDSDVTAGFRSPGESMDWIIPPGAGRRRRRPAGAPRGVGRVRERSLSLTDMTGRIVEIKHALPLQVWL
jgi:hypothetical protein